MPKGYGSKLMNEKPLSGSGEYTKEMRIANLAKARLARGKSKTVETKGAYTKEMRIANLAKARLARGKSKPLKGKGITSEASNAIQTAIGRGITSEASNAIQTAIGKGYYNQDYVPSDQINFQGNPLDNMDYSKIRARRKDKEKRGEYTYSKEMAEDDMPIPTISGDGMKSHKKKYPKHYHEKHHNSYEEDLVEDGYIPRLSYVPREYTQLMTGSGWNDFLNVLRTGESVMRGINTGAQLYSGISQGMDRATPSSMPTGNYGRMETPNQNYTQTQGLYEPSNESFTDRPRRSENRSAMSQRYASIPHENINEYQMVGQPLSDRPNRRTSSIANVDRIAGRPPLSDRPTRQSDIDRIAGRPLQRPQNYKAYEEFDALPKYEEPKKTSKTSKSQRNTFEDYLTPERPPLRRPTREAPQPPQAPLRRPTREAPQPPSRRAISSNDSNWQQAESELVDGRKAKPDIFYKPQDLQQPSSKAIRPTSRDIKQQIRYRSQEKYEPIENLDRELRNRPKSKPTPAPRPTLNKKEFQNFVNRQEEIEANIPKNPIRPTQAQLAESKRAIGTKKLRQNIAKYERQDMEERIAKEDRDISAKRALRKQKSYDTQQEYVRQAKEGREKFKQIKQARANTPKITVKSRIPQEEIRRGAIKQDIKRKERKLSELRKGRLSEERYGKEELRERAPTEPKQKASSSIDDILRNIREPRPEVEEGINQMRLQERLEEAKAKRPVGRPRNPEKAPAEKRPVGRPKKK